MQTTIMQIGPEEAAGMLQLNIRNRSLNAKAVGDMARAMTNGEWILNGESIKLAIDGTLLDGQHRLAAIVQAGVYVPMLVIDGLAPSTQDTIDMGRRRSVADYFGLDGETNSTVLAAIVRRAWLWENGHLKFPSSPTPTVPEMREILAKYPSLRRSADLATSITHSFRPSRAAATGTAHHILHQIDQGLTAEFFAQFSSGAGLDEGHPVLALRNRILQDRLTKKNVPFHQGVAFFFRAWNALREDRTMARIVHTAEEPMIKPV